MEALKDFIPSLWPSKALLVVAGINGNSSLPPL